MYPFVSLLSRFTLAWNRLQCRFKRHSLELVNTGLHWAVSCKWCTFYQTWSPVARKLYYRWRD